MIKVSITSTGNMYAKRELAITFSTCLSFMLRKVVHDGTVTKEQEIILAKERQQKLVWVQTCNVCTLPKVLMQNSLDGAV